jgi:hypothetical protein
MKKLLSIIALGLMFQVATVPRANAGFLFYTAITLKKVASKDFPLILDVGLIGLNGLAAKGALKLHEFMMSSVPTDSPDFGIYGSVFIIVSSDHLKQKSAMSAELRAKYPFINDQSVIDELSETLVDRFHATESEDKEFVEVKLAEQTTRNILSRTDLLESQVNQVVNDLM